jgi:phage shock protein A
MLQDTIHTVILGSVLFAMLYVLFDKRFRALAWYGYQSLMTAITSLFITVDPIGIVKNYIKSMKANLEKMESQMGVLKGQMESLKSTMKSNSVQANKALALAAQAGKQGEQNAVILNTRSAARLSDSNANLGVLAEKLEVLYRVLDKMSGSAETIITDTEDEVNTREREYKAISAGTSAMRSAMSVIKGDPDKKAIFDMSMEHLADNISNQVGEMDNFMRMADKITGNIDLQNGVFQEEGMKMLQDWEHKADSGLLLSPAEKKQIIAASKDPDDKVELLVKGDNPYKGVLKSAKK